jgi:hypothetical protein
MMITMMENEINKKSESCYAIMYNHELSIILITHTHFLSLSLSPLPRSINFSLPPSSLFIIHQPKPKPTPIMLSHINQFISAINQPEVNIDS